MGKISKAFALLLVLIIAMSILTVAKAQNDPSIPIPAIPQFTLKITEHSLDIPSSLSTDPYTGENITHPAEHYEWKTIDIAIKKQSHSYDLYFSVEMRGHFSQDWLPLAYVQQYDDNLETDLSYIPRNQTYPPNSSGILDVPLGVQLDFRVKAWTGYEARGGPPLYMWTKYGAESDYSNIQTITIPEVNPTATPTDTPTPTSNEPTDNSITLSLTTLALIILIVALVPSIALIIFYRKRQRGKPNE